MTLHVHTARISYSGPDRFDITRKSGGSEGVIFAPSWNILRPALDARQKATRLREIADALPGIVREVYRNGTLQNAYDIERRAWAQYEPAYLAEMRESYRVNRQAWNALLARERVVLVCYCVDSERCHRTLLGQRILTAFGAVYEGERVA